jgi:hypothetical protein
MLLDAAAAACHDESRLRELLGAPWQRCSLGCAGKTEEEEN